RGRAELPRERRSVRGCRWVRAGVGRPSWGPGARRCLPGGRAYAGGRGRTPVPAGCSDQGAARPGLPRAGPAKPRGDVAGARSRVRVMDDDPEAYGAAWAAEYDGLFEDRDDPLRVSARLKALTAGRRLLEVGVGTGRLALPLHDDGWTVA